ncbi:immunoglobulin lambda-1 light chain-like [Silurus meridionalis]|uniref:immunoglobulin lambda-1 light chain-like n=1 Tax=Silurus meridionalis TaxID=175797 RepID=UPI001EEC7EDD|nr:immunoglobulin lambda-1 light chain-like [Silurus meridionalis]
MLLSICTLLPALALVSSQKVVTQKPSVRTQEKGNTVTMDCNIAKDESNYVSWYKQIPQEAPQFVLRFYYSNSSPGKYGDNFSSTRFTSKASTNIDYQLIISNVEVGDSAVYYCGTRDDSTSGYVFGQGTKLIVSDAALPAPVLNLLPPSSEELKSTKATLVCLANDVAGGFADVRWLVNGNPVTSGVITGSAQQQANKKFSLSSYLTIDSSEWENDKVITCEVSAGGKAASVKIKKSECSE